MPKGKPKQQQLARRQQQASRVHTAPAAVSFTFENRAPQITQTRDGCIIEHTEYVGPYISDPDNQFAYYGDSLSPSNPELFPWLCQIATRFESFVIHSATAFIRSAVGSTFAGDFILACDYDADDPDGAETEASLLNMAGAKNDNVWKGVTMTLDSARLRKIGPTRFVQGGEETPNRLNSAGILYWGMTPTTVGFAGSPITYQQIAVGRRFIKYRIEFRTPQLGSALENQRAWMPQLIAYSTAAGRIPAPAGVVVNAPATTSIVNMFASGDVDPASKFVEVVTNGAIGSFGRYFDLAGNAVGVGVKLLKVIKDFQGMIRVVLPKLVYTAGTTVNPVNIGLAQFVPGGSSAANTTLYDVPDIASNEWTTLASTVVNSATDGIWNADIAAKLAKGSVFTITTGQTAGAAPLFTSTAGSVCGLSLDPYQFSTAAAFANNDRHMLVKRSSALKNGPTHTNQLLCETKSRPGLLSAFPATATGSDATSGFVVLR